MEKLSFSGKNTEDAIEKAAQFFHVDKTFVSYNVLQEKPRGLLARIFSRNQVQIEAWVHTDAEDLKAAARKAVQEALQKQRSDPLKSQKIETKKSVLQKRSPVTDQDSQVTALLEEYKSVFFAPFQIQPDQLSYEVKDRDVTIHVQDEFIETLLSKSDKLSLSFEHVFKRIAQKKYGDLPGRVTLDAGISIEKREERLASMARNLAEKVKKTGKSIVLSSKSGQERRVIHMALESMEGVATKSSGTGDKRRLIIYSTSTTTPAKPKRKKQSHARHNNP